ncbi:MAG: hypothetical protein RSP_05140 [Rhodanobacter sp.]
MRGLTCFVLLLVAGCGVRAAEPPTVTVCQLYDQRQSPPAGEVRFQARALMGPRHGAIFMDPHCPPGTAIPFRFADHLPPDSQAVMFDHALTGDVMDLSLRSFDAEVTGTYAPATTINPRGLFTVDRVVWFRKSPPKAK